MNENIMVKIGANISDLQRSLSTAGNNIDAFGNEVGAMGNVVTRRGMSPITNMGINATRTFKGMSEASRKMTDEMRNAFGKQKESMTGFRDDMVKVQHGYFKMAEGSKAYKGTTQEFMSEVSKMGKQHKTVTENMMKNNELMKMSFLQTVGTMLNRSTQASKISDNFDRMKNPLYSINKAGLAAADGLNKIAMNGNASVLALKMLGPTANMKALKDMTMMINQGLMRFMGVALIAAVGAAVFYSAMHKGAMELDKGYAEAFKNMGATVKKAFEPMIQVFAAVMTPVYNVIAAVAGLIVKFNEANPALAKVLAGFLLLIPALTLILAPLAIGIGLTGGLTAAFGALWVVIGPIVTGFAAMMGTVLLVAAAIALLVGGVVYAYKNFETFRNIVDSVLKFLKTTFTAAFVAIKAVVVTAMTAIVAFGKSMMDKFAAFWRENGEQITSYAKVAWAAISLVVKTQLNNLKLAFDIAFAAIKAVVTIAWEAIKLIFKTVMNVVLGLATAFLAVFRGDWQGAWDAITGIYKKTWNDIKTFASGSLNALKTLFTSILGAIKDYIANNLELIKSTFKEKWEAIIAFMQGIDLKSVGSDIIQGLIDGIVGKASSLLNKAKEIANSVKDVFKGLFDINSPSRYMENFIGKNMMFGWINGIDSMKRAVLSTSEKAAGWMTPATPTLAYQTPSTSAGVRATSLAAGTSATSGGPVTNNYYATIDAKNVTEFNDVVTFMNALPQQMRKK